LADEKSEWLTRFGDQKAVESRWVTQTSEDKKPWFLRAHWCCGGPRWTRSWR